jgi:lipopolysaccharide transport protein LptA
MRWQRVAQAVIALFVIGFIAVLVTSLRRKQPPVQTQPPPEAIVPDATLVNPGGGQHEVIDPTGRQRWAAVFGNQVVLADGRMRLGQGVDVRINRADGPVTIKARDADIVPSEDGGLKDAVFRGDVKLIKDGGLQVTTPEATYSQATGIVTMPGHVEFSKGRMKGSGDGATYDQNREVFWIKSNPRVIVAPGQHGDGALDAVAQTIGLARAEHYVVLQGDAKITAEARTAQANEITVRLTDDDERIRVLELRGNSRMSGGAGGPQSMSARDIDMTYAEDGRTLQQARLVDNAVVQLAGAAAGKRIAGNTIDIGLAPDGATMTSLSANERVQVDLPPEGNGPSKRIRSATLTATGAGEAGLQNAIFGGGVEYRESRAAARNLAALERTARSQTLIIDTQPGLGAIERADFRGSVKFTEAPDFVAEAQQGIYHLKQDRLDLMPAQGQPGPASPSVSDGKVSVAARTIQFSLSTREMTAETKVRSTMQSQASRRSRGNTQGKTPSMLNDTEPVNVTSNRLEYNGAKSAAVYTGNVVLWQGTDTTIKAAAITIDDATGNLTATGSVTTTFLFEETDAKTGQRRRQLTTGNSDTFRYDDAKRLATYDGKAHMKGLQGDVTGDRIELFLKAGANELERAEAYGANGAVQVREGRRLAKGSHLTYTASNDRYLMIGTPVEVVEEKNGTCTQTIGATVTFDRTTEAALVKGSETGTPMRAVTLKACPPGLGR